MNSQCLIILSLIIIPLHFISAQVSSQREKSLITREEQVQTRQADSMIGDLETQIHKTSHHHKRPNTDSTQNYRSQRSRCTSRHHQRNIRDAYWILIIIGWGTLLPIGVIIARYFKNFPIDCEEYWYAFHITCQSGGYVLGAIGWCLGFSSNQYINRANLILGILIFTFTTIQMLAIVWKPKKEDEYGKCWEIYHKVLGYVIVALIITDIFLGIVSRQSQTAKWEWLYVTIFAILGLTAITLEIFSWIKSMSIKQTAQLSSIEYPSPELFD